MSDLQEMAIGAIKSLPKSASLDEILEEIIVQAKIAEGLLDSREGRTYSIDQVEAHFDAKP